MKVLTTRITPTESWPLPVGSVSVSNCSNPSSINACRINTPILRRLLIELILRFDLADKETKKYDHTPGIRVEVKVEQPKSLILTGQHVFIARLVYLSARESLLKHRC